MATLVVCFPQGFGAQYGMPKTILIVEDNPDARFVYQTMLNYDGYRVLEATNGRDGVEVATREQPDLIIMDISMPILDGLSATELLRADHRTAAIPIIAVTGDEFSHQTSGRAATLFTAVYRKPVSPNRIVSEVRDLIGPPDSDDDGNDARRPARPGAA